MEPKNDNDLGPFTLEEAEQWLGRLEDIATLERDLGFGTRMVLNHLFSTPARSGLIDGRRFITEIQDVLPQLEAPERLGTQAVLGALREQLPLPTPEQSGGSRH